MAAVLTCRNLTVTYPGGVAPISGISFHVEPGECFALVGCSGAGKTTVARALMGLHQHGTSVTGEVWLDGQEMSGASSAAWRRVWGRQLGFVAQNPWAGCDPLRTVGDHVAEAWRCHGLAVSWSEVTARLDGLGVMDASHRLHQHPHTWSGGMLQRASIAAAGALDPPLLIADEPTSALDADRSQSVLEALRALGAAVVLISHDIGLVLRNADRVGVLHAGKLVEQGTPEQLQSAPRHEETRRLLAALAPLPPRDSPPASACTPLLAFEGVSVSYDRGRVQALSSTDMTIGAGEIVGVQGPSGCGKSTLLRMAMGIEQPSGGTIRRADSLHRPGAVLPVFQDPVGSLVPHWPIWRSISEPLTAPGHPRTRRSERRARALDAMARVGLGNLDPSARPAELSVGQCQRAALARATMTRPVLIVADEPTSALDSPSTWRVGKLLREAADSGAAVLIVSHDGAFLEWLTDRVITMDAGRILPERRDT
ncbi:MAG: ABC transporter ATP-binding protein [Gammaproteobacteria bacterium]|nr:MAG: ABC transporter ATP-binding protein [Gammaproteobacteria bacterium]